MSPSEFAAIRGFTDRAARKIFRRCAAGNSWNGITLPVERVSGQRGGQGGEVWGLRVDLCPLEVLARLGLSEPTSSPPVERQLQARPEDRHFAAAGDRQRIIAPILGTARGSAARAAAFRQVAAQPAHQVGGIWVRVAERTLRDWVKAAETDAAALVKRARRDKGERRVRITRRWDAGCGLPDHAQERIAGELERQARGLIGKKVSERKVRALCKVVLMRLTTEAGASLAKAELARLCDLTGKWVARFRDMKMVAEADLDHKRYTDRHEAHVRRTLTARPMEVLMGDVHHVDLTIADARASRHQAIRQAAEDAAQAGKDRIKALLIGWMDAASGYLWATPALAKPGQGVTQRDVALSLYQVLSCEWGGMPEAFMVDNGTEFGFLVESVQRFAAMADMIGPRVVKCRPYSPEGKGRLEGAFGIIEKGFFSALPGFNGGDPMRPRLHGRGKPVAPYALGAPRLRHDLDLAVAQYNGTPQHGNLNGLSPKAMLEHKIAAQGWKAQTVDPDMFDLVFSREERRDVRQCQVTIGKRSYSGDVLAELVGERQVPFLVPFRDPEGPILHVRNEVIHRLVPESFGLLDPAGAARKAELAGEQEAELARRRATADMTVDVQQMLSASADLSPVQHNEPDRWTASVIDKGGFLVPPITEREARERQDAEDRADMEEFLALSRAGKREAGGCNRRPL